MSGYVINEEDIEKTLCYLKIHRPEKVNRACAIQLLEIMHKAIKKLVKTDIIFAEELEKALLELDKKGVDN